jgi:hypothetical protein
VHPGDMPRSITVLALLAGTSLAAADPAGTVVGAPGPKKVESISFRDQAQAIATELVNVQSNSDPELFVSMWSVNRWTRSGKAARLRTAAAGATLLGEALLAFDASPLAVLGAFAGAATLDQAANDLDADEANRRGDTGRPLVPPR